MLLPGARRHISSRWPGTRLGSLLRPCTSSTFIAAISADVPEPWGPVPGDSLGQQNSWLPEQVSMLGGP